MKNEAASGSLDYEESKNSKPRKRRYWGWITAGVIVFILVVSWFNREGELIAIQQGRFELMVKQQAISKIVLVKNQKLVEITLKPQAIQNAIYRQELERANSPFGVDPAGPHYKLLIASVEHFYDNYDEITQPMPPEQRVDVQVEERSDVTGMLINWAFLFLIIFGMVRLIRWMIGSR